MEAPRSRSPSPPCNSLEEPWELVLTASDSQRAGAEERVSSTGQEILLKTVTDTDVQTDNMTTAFNKLKVNVTDFHDYLHFLPATTVDIIIACLGRNYDVHQMVMSKASRKDWDAVEQYPVPLNFRQILVNPKSKQQLMNVLPDFLKNTPAHVQGAFFAALKGLSRPATELWEVLRDTPNDLGILNLSTIDTDVFISSFWSDLSSAIERQTALHTLGIPKELDYGYTLKASILQMPMKRLILNVSDCAIQLASSLPDSAIAKNLECLEIIVPSQIVQKSNLEDFQSFVNTFINYCPKLQTIILNLDGTKGHENCLQSMPPESLIKTVEISPHYAIYHKIGTTYVVTLPKLKNQEPVVE
jgi:hypothetical protein